PAHTSPSLAPHWLLPLCAGGLGVSLLELRWIAGAATWCLAHVVGPVGSGRCESCWQWDSCDGGRLPVYLRPAPSHALCPSRARYISTELGIRQRLFVGVLTSKSTLNTLAVAVNRTLGHRLERLVYFTGTRGRKVPHGMTVVTHGDERPIWNMYQTIKYVLDHYVGDFDWFYLVQDDTYTEAHRVSRLVAHLSIDALLYLGRPEEFIGGDTEGRYCYGGFGYLLSRSLLLRLQPHLENCRNDILSARPDEWLGRCVIDYTAVNCVEEHEGLRYQYFELGKNMDLERESDPRFQSAFTAHPVLDPVQMYRLHKHFAQVELERTYQEIQQLQVRPGAPAAPALPVHGPDCLCSVGGSVQC
uniref:Hexosyltransferase n=1 Tax=Pelusios castaneus TaxID=367368 RepID=A0A8C8VKP7_9SAUR